MGSGFPRSPISSGSGFDSRPRKRKMKIAILGFGREGQSLLKFLKKNPVYPDAEIQIRDKKLDKNYLKDLERFDLIFRSPGIPYTLKEITRARQRGAVISSATKLFFEKSRERGVKIIGITGSKGKTTTATLLYRMLRAGGKRVFLAGNIGKSPLDILPQLRKNDWVVLELSSFQLQDMTTSPQIAVILEIFPEHQDIHKSVKEYYAAKAAIARYQNKKDLVFFFKHNPVSRKIAFAGKGKKIGVAEKGFNIFSASDLKTPGKHTFLNAVMAARVAEKLKVKPQTIRRVVKTFRGVEHRLELVRSLRLPDSNLKASPKPSAKRHFKRRGKIAVWERQIKFYNDSASTNPQTTAAAVKAFSTAPLILIAGGYDKGLDYKPLAKALKNSQTQMVILYGQNKKKIYQALRPAGVPTKLLPDLKSAVNLAYQAAKKSAAEIVLFSPGAASFDQFKNYADRGRRFKQIVKALP
jgi:UDP-N-acetylmuramoylalanine--D-glutamate ligase